MTKDYQAIGQAGVAALRRGDAAAARAAFGEVEAAGRGSHQLRLLLAQACQLAGDAPGAHAALDKVLREEPTNLYALILRGDLLTAAGDDRAAVSWYRAAILQAPRAGTLPPDLRAMLRGAEIAVARAETAFEAHLDRALDGLEPAGARFEEARAILGGQAQPQLQQPTSFYYPQLPQRPFFDRAGFAWVAALEAAVPAIRAELAEVLAGPDALVPYVTAEENRPAKRHALMDDLKWSAFHLWRGGAPVPENAVRCPATMAALEQVAMPRIADRSPMAMFSVLEARTHIPPHNGMLNTRLICHLPLIVPEGCRLRVGNDTRAVEAGRMMIFDDTIEHEAWNDSPETRVVLLFEVWRPELDAAERAALAALFGGDAIALRTRCRRHIAQHNSPSPARRGVPG